MKKLNLILLFISASFICFAGKDLEARATTLTNNMEKSLALSPEQKSKVNAIVLTKLEKLDKLSADKNDDNVKKEIMIEKRKFITEIKNVITQEQYIKWQKLRNEQIAATKKGEKIENPVFDKDMEMMLN